MDFYDVPLGIIGAGHSARNIVKALNNGLIAPVIAVSASTKEEANEFAKDFGIEHVFPDSNSLIKKAPELGIKAIILSVPHNLHYPLAKKCIQFGVPVLIEKPLAMNVSEGKDLIKLSLQNKVPISVFFQNRFTYSAKQARKIIETRELGRILHVHAYVYWYRDLEYYTKSPWRGKWATEGGGSLINQAIHTIDLISWLIGKPSKVFGDWGAWTHPIEVDDNSASLWIYNDKKFVSFHTSLSMKPSAPATIKIFCERGKIIIEGFKLSILNQEGKKIHTEQDISSDKDFDEKEFVKIEYLKTFCNALKNSLKMPVPPDSALTCLEIINAIYESKGEKVIAL